MYKVYLDHTAVEGRWMERAGGGVDLYRSCIKASFNLLPFLASRVFGEFIGNLHHGVIGSSLVYLLLIESSFSPFAIITPAPPPCLSRPTTTPPWMHQTRHEKESISKRPTNNRATRQQGAKVFAHQRKDQGMTCMM